MQNRKTIVACCLLIASCARDAVRSPEQAKAIALSSVCAQAKPLLAPNETMPTEWLAERRGDKWYVWLPFGQGAQFRGGMGALPRQYGHFGAWINPIDGKVLYCERGGGQAPMPAKISAPPPPQPQN